MIYRCIKDFEIPFTNEDGSPTEQYGFVVADSLWELYEGTHSMTGAQIHLDPIDDECCGFSWIEISSDRFAECFELESGVE